jgi:integration host factor subunit alpha
MTKADLVDIIFGKVGLSKIESQNIIEMIFETIRLTLVEGESVKVSGFGTFNVKKKNARRGRNPKTGDELQITPRRVVTFRASNHFKEQIEKVDA